MQTDVQQERSSHAQTEQITLYTCVSVVNSIVKFSACA
jgi:hypothetical protein